eukprot:COSAG02_NODE_12220_length_1578_cov_1.618661_2_plen_272_part_01
MASPRDKREMRKLRGALAEAVELEICTHAHADAVWREVVGGSDSAERAAAVWLASVSRSRAARPTQLRKRRAPRRRGSAGGSSVHSPRQYSPEARRRTPSPRRSAGSKTCSSPDYLDEADRCTPSPRRSGGSRARSPREYLDEARRRGDEAQRHTPSPRRSGGSRSPRQYLDDARQPRGPLGSLGPRAAPAAQQHWAEARTRSLAPRVAPGAQQSPDVQHHAVHRRTPSPRRSGGSRSRSPRQYLDDARQPRRPLGSLGARAAPSAQQHWAE